MMRLIRNVLPTDLTSRIVGWWAARMTNAYSRALRVHIAWEEPERHPRLATEGCIYSSWHENILLMTYIGAYHGIRVLVSQSRDGKYITSIIENMGYQAIRGSSSRGAVRAVRQLVQQDSTALLAFTPDGPRGPRREFQPGAVYVASRTGLPLIPVGFAYERAWRASSWDRFVIPSPFSRAACYGGEPFFVPPDANAEQLAEYQRRASEIMSVVTARAERLLVHAPQYGRIHRCGPGQHVPDLPHTVMKRPSAPSSAA